jgi:hypothetical protein
MRSPTTKATLASPLGTFSIGRPTLLPLDGKGAGDGAHSHSAANVSELFEVGPVVHALAAGGSCVSRRMRALHQSPTGKQWFAVYYEDKAVTGTQPVPGGIWTRMDLPWAYGNTPEDCLRQALASLPVWAAPPSRRRAVRRASSSGGRPQRSSQARSRKNHCDCGRAWIAEARPLDRALVRLPCAS